MLTAIVYNMIGGDHMCNKGEICTNIFSGREPLIKGKHYEIL